MGSKGLWCTNCALFHRPQVTDDTKLCCSFCGKVISDNNWSEEGKFGQNSALQYKRKSDIQGTSKDEKVHFRKDDNAGTKHVAIDDSDSVESHGSNKLSGASEDSDTLSDIDDLEIDSYINTKKERHYKKIIWEELNRDYIEEKEKQAKESKNSVPTQTAAETFKSKINYAVLDELFNESTAKKSHCGEGGKKAKPNIDGRTPNRVQKLNKKT